MTSEQRAKLIRSDAGSRQNSSQGGLEDVSPGMNRHGNGWSVGVLHDVVTARDTGNLVSGAFQRLNHFRSRYRRDCTRHKSGSYQKSGYVECQSQLVWYPDLFDQALKGRAEVGDSSLRRLSLAERRSVRPQVGRGGPETGLVLLKDVGHVNDASHRPIMHELAVNLSRC
jgi:hypothetical protein